jgi:hypothetical protein
MKPLTYPEALDEVARTLEYQNFEDYKNSESDYEYLQYAQEQAAILYARSKWEEACQLQKAKCIQSLPYPHRQLSFNKLFKLIEDSPKPEFKP